jgi:hypothetical protein
MMTQPRAPITADPFAGIDSLGTAVLQHAAGTTGSLPRK